jgi:ABC-type branched-subunit amino acid transport system substrate-binding protein
LSNKILFFSALILLTLPACSPVSVPNVSITTFPGATATAEVATLEPTATATASPTPENIPALTGETVVLPAFCDQSSILSSGNNGRIQGMEDTQAAINSAGGIFGAELDIRVIDTEGNPEAAQRALAQAVRQFGEVPLVLICDPQTEAALNAMLNEDEVPALGPGDFAERGGFVFGVDATPQEHLGHFIDDLMAHWEERKPEGAADEIRVALISWNAKVSGMLTSEEFLLDLQDLGVQVVYQADLPAELETNLYDVVYQTRDANANVIFTNLRGFGLAGLLNALQSLGLRERFVVGTPGAGYETQLFEYLAEPQFLEGLYVTSPWAWWAEHDHPGIQLAAQLGDGEMTHDWGYLEMAGAVFLAERALEDAILEVGFDELNPETVTDALGALEDYPVASELFTVDYSGGTRSLNGSRTWVAGIEIGSLTLVK